MRIEASESTASSRERGPARKRVGSWLWVGLALSIPLHILLVAILARIPIAKAGPIGEGESTIEVVIVEGDPLEQEAGLPAQGESSTPELSSVSAASVGTSPEAFGMPDPTGNSDGDAPAAAQGAPGLFSDAGGGSGEGGMGGGGAETSFFGVGGRGKKVAYVVDKSGSMGAAVGDGRDVGPLSAPPSRLRVAKDELNRSFSALPDYASVNIALFDTGVVTFDPDGQFVRCREEVLSRLRQWLRDIAPGGGTDPVPAFRLVFSRSERPDLVFFMSDGEIPTDAAEEILRLNRRGPNTVIHCIAFGQAAATAPLRRIAAETGGTFAVVTPGAP